MKDIKRLTYICLFVLVICAASSAMAASSDGLTDVGTADVPCYVKIAAGGELRVAIDIDRKAELEIKKAADESEVVVMEYRNGKQRKGSQAETAKLDNNEYSKTWKFNKYFEQTPESSVVDEIRIAVKKGAVYAEAGQTGDHRIDFYNTGYQRGTTVNPKMSLSVRITGDNQSGGKTSGNLILESETDDGQEKIPFTIEKGKTLKWDYPVEKGVNSVDVDISEGMAKVSLFQPSDYRAAEPVETKTASQSKQTPKTVAAPATTKADKIEAKASKTAEKAALTGTILNGEAPLMEGARVIKETGMGATSRVDFEAPATPEEVVNFYKKAMTARGWQPGMAMVQGTMGVLQLSKGKSQITLKATGDGQKSTVNMAITTY